MGIGLIAAGSSGSANDLFHAVTGINLGSSSPTSALNAAVIAGDVANAPGSGSSGSSTPPGAQSTVGSTSGITGQVF